MKTTTTQLTPSAISKYWDLILVAVKNSLPSGCTLEDIDPLRVYNLCLGGSIQVWAIFDMESNDEEKLIAMVITSLSQDMLSGNKNLIITNLYGFDPFGMSKEHIINGFNTIRKWAIHEQCKHILAFTVKSNIESIVEMLQGSTYATLLDWRL